VGVGVGVGEAVGVGVGVAVGVGEAVAVGVGAGFAIAFFCQINLLPTFLQMRDPEVVLTFEHFTPNLAVEA
jgi:hypothetical protein